MALIFSTAIKFFFLFAPFFVVSMFLAMTKSKGVKERAKIANRAVIAATCISLVLMFFGEALFSILGITLDSFRIGAGSLLFLSAVSLVSDGVRNHATSTESVEDVAVVPLAIPTIIGPATIGAILVIGAELESEQLVYGILGMLIALLALLVLLHISVRIEKVLGRTGLNILSKITGLILAAMAAQIVFSGIKSFLNL